MQKPALFLDRDGVINVDYGYVCQQENFHFVEGIFALVTVAKRAGYLVIVVTNQAGIGRGYYTEADFHRLMRWVGEQFVIQGGSVDAVYFCLYHAEKGIGQYKQQSPFRKPAPGMILEAAEKFSIDLASSMLIGDNISDIQAGSAARVGKLFLLGSDHAEAASYGAIKIKNLAAAMAHL